jgi:16S rRNA processing protein RimM
VAAPRLIEVGRVAGAFGVRGEIRITAYTEDPLALLRYRVLARADGTPALTLTGGRAAKGGLVARATEIADRTQAEAARGLRLYIARDALPPPDEDEFYLADLIGLEARDASGAVIGRVRAVEDFGAGDLLEIQPESGPTWWLAFTRETVPEVAVDAGYLVVLRPPEAEADLPSPG